MLLLSFLWLLLRSVLVSANSIFQPTFADLKIWRRKGHCIVHILDCQLITSSLLFFRFGLVLVFLLRLENVRETLLYVRTYPMEKQ